MLFTAQQNNTLVPADRQAEIWMAKQSGQVELKPVTAAMKRSTEANAKYWAWCHQVEQEQGMSAGDAHRHNKWHIGMAILTREHPEYRDRLMTMIRPLDYETRLAVMDLISCTSMFNRSEMSEYMDNVQRHWAEQGINLQ